MSRELKIYNQFDELILHVEHAPNAIPSLRIIDGTPELRSAIRSLAGHPFERLALLDGQMSRFEAEWGDADFLNVVASYWRANFGWRTKIVEKAPAFTFVMAPDCFVLNAFPPNCSAVTVPVAGKPALLQSYGNLFVPAEINAIGAAPLNFFAANFQYSQITNTSFICDYESNVAAATGEQFAIASLVENNPDTKPRLNARLGNVA
jgi:hypothetical protein